MNKDIIRAKDWKGKDLEGVWEYNFKIDGVRVIIRDGKGYSRNGKPLQNIPKIGDGDYECFLGTFKDTISAVKTFNRGCEIPATYFYPLCPSVDKRLVYYCDGSGKAAHINNAFKEARLRGYEGLILRQGDTWLKVKDRVTYDLEVTRYIEGRGKHEGRMGALFTSMGKIGTGFTDVDREKYTEEYIIGKIIEVEAMEVTEAGKLRHPRFLRLREDK